MLQEFAMSSVENTPFNMRFIFKLNLYHIENKEKNVRLGSIDHAPSGENGVPNRGVQGPKWGPK